MFSQIICASALVLSVLATPTPLPPCSWNTTKQPCSCAAGTYLVNATTRGVIGADVDDVAKITDDFHQTAWFGSVTASTTGNGKQAGATRTFTQGPYSFVEELYQLKQKGCGDFTMKYIQHDVPVTFDIPGAPQTYAGQWDTLRVHSSGKDKTSIYWNIYSCFSFESPFAQFHEAAINNVTDILKAQGKIRGPGEAPHTETISNVPKSASKRSLTFLKF